MSVAPGSWFPKRMKNVLSFRFVSSVFALMLALLWVGDASAGSPRMRIDHADSTNFKQLGKLIFYVDIVDGDEQVVERMESKHIQFLVNGKEETGHTRMTNIKDTGDGTAIMIVIPAHQGFVSGEGGRKALGRVVSGVKNFVNLLGQQDRVSIVTYTEQGYDIRHPFSHDFESAAKDLEAFASELERKEKMDKPALPKLLDKHLPWLIKNGFKAPNLPERRILFLVTAGHDYSIENRSDERVAKKVEQLARYAKDLTVGPLRRVYVVGVLGFTERDKQGPFRSLAELTGGEFYSPEFSEDFEAIQDGILSLGERILKQYVISWYPEDWTGGKATLRLQADVKGTMVYQDVERKWPERPFPWLKAVLIGLGALLGLIALFLLIRNLWRRRSQRRSDDEPVDVGAGPGRARAYLQVNSGAQAGEELYLEDEVITFGKSDACDFQIYDENMSRRHAAIRVEDLRFELSDLKSTNGVFVNGKRVEKCFLKDADVLRFGHTDFTFKLIR